MRYLWILSAFMVGAVWASDEHREHGAHVHGHANINLALSGRDLELDLDSPAMNLLGFEHEAESVADQEKLKQTVAFLENADNWLKLGQRADCSVTKVAVESSLLEDEHRNESHEMEQYKGESHEEAHEEHEHEGHIHADFEVAVQVRCDKPEQLDTVDLSGLFQQFPGFEDVDVQWLTDSTQSAAELNAQQPVISLH
jgi:hypothetical protein